MNLLTRIDEGMTNHWDTLLVVYTGVLIFILGVILGFTIGVIAGIQIP